MLKGKSTGLKGEKFYIFNKGNTILLRKPYDDEIYIYEKNFKGSDYKLNQKFLLKASWGLIGLTILSNELIVTSGRKFIFIFKKDKNSHYIKNQELLNGNWAEITIIKELNNIQDHFAVCGWYGFMIFKRQNNDKYEIELELNDSNGISHIGDFLEIKGKERSFILCGSDNIIIIKDKNILNKIEFQEQARKSWLYANYICEFKEELFFASGERYITLINTNDNSFKQIDILKEDKFDQREKFPLLDNSAIYKYNNNSIILLIKKGIFIIQIFESERIQVNIHINIGINHYNYIGFDYDAKLLYYVKKGFLCKLKLNKKYIYK